MCIKNKLMVGLTCLLALRNDFLWENAYVLVEFFSLISNQDLQWCFSKCPFHFPIINIFQRISCGTFCVANDVVCVWGLEAYGNFTSRMEIQDAFCISTKGLES